MDHLARIDPHCRRLLSRMYGSGTLSNRDLREPWFGRSGFNPRTLARHLPHLEEQNLVIVEHARNSDRYSLTVYGEKVAARAMANEGRVPVGPTKETLDLLFHGANSNPATVNDFAVSITYPPQLSARITRAHTEQIKLHRRKQLPELAWFRKRPDLTGIGTRSTMAKLDTLSSNSVRDASVDLRTDPDPGWQTVQRGMAKLRAPVADPGLNPNDWQQRGRRRFELESTFKEVPIIELPPWFE